MTTEQFERLLLEADAANIARDGSEHPTWCLAYHRDRGDSLRSSDLHRQWSHLIDAADYFGAEWLYLWIDGRWLHAKIESNQTPIESLKPLPDFDAATPARVM